MLDDGEIKIAQTTLGFLFRKLTMEFSELAAREYLKWGYNNFKRHRWALQEALGENYALKYGTFFLPFVDPDELGKFAYLRAGANGTVYSTIWNTPQYQGGGGSTMVSVALKQPKQGLREAEEREKFVTEVICSCLATLTGFR